MLGSYFYNATTKKTIAVFGSLFNNIRIQRKNATGKILKNNVVPLAYGPKEKFLTLIEKGSLDDKKVAMRLPRMSFELVSFDPLSERNLNKFNLTQTSIDGFTSNINRQGNTYMLTFSLSVMASNQDDALQVVEQIIPNFKPNYTVTVKEFSSSPKPLDLVFTLASGPTPNVDYEGDFQTSRRTIIYEFNFTVPVYYSLGVADSPAKVIRHVTVNLFGNSRPDGSDPLANLKVDVDEGGTPEDYTVTTTFGFDE